MKRINRRPEKEVLIDLHFDKKLSSLKIGEMYGVHPCSVMRWFKFYGLSLIGNTFQKGRTYKQSLLSEKQKTHLEYLSELNKIRVSPLKGRQDVTYTCLKCSKEFVDCAHTKRKYCGNYCRTKASGEVHGNFKGKETINKRRNWTEYTLFKKEVHIRDENKCRICLNKGEQVHHLYPFSTHKSLRVDFSNGVLLCKKCHKIVHKKCGIANYTFEKFNSFYEFSHEKSVWEEIKTD